MGFLIRCTWILATAAQSYAAFRIVRGGLGKQFRCLLICLLVTVFRSLALMFLAPYPRHHWMALTSPAMATLQAFVLIEAYRELTVRHPLFHISGSVLLAIGAGVVLAASFAAHWGMNAIGYPLDIAVTIERNAMAMMAAVLACTWLALASTSDAPPSEIAARGTLVLSVQALALVLIYSAATASGFNLWLSGFAPEAADLGISCLWGFWFVRGSRSLPPIVARQSRLADLMDDLNGLVNLAASDLRADEDSEPRPPSK
jgi:hypothetical protein